MHPTPTITFLAIVLLFTCLHVRAQKPEVRMAFIVDSVLIVDDPQDGNDLRSDEISDLAVIRNKDSLKSLGYERFDGVTYIFTKAYRARPDSIRRIPTTLRMERREGIIFWQGTPYTGPVIDYYYSGRRYGTGRFVNGKAEGADSLYYQNGHLSLEREYKEGVADGMERIYYPDGTLKQEGRLTGGKEEGVWKEYFPNGAIRQYGIYRNGELADSGINYYSNGKIRRQLLSRNGKIIPDQRLVKVNEWMTKSQESNKDGDMNDAIFYVTKAIRSDSTYAPAWFARGTLKLNDLKFEEAIADFDKGLELEPYTTSALVNRAIARIRKYQFANSRTLSKNKDVEVLASPDKVDIPKEDNDKICHDLELAMYMGEERSKMITEALSNYCHITSMRL